MTCKSVLAELLYVTASDERIRFCAGGRSGLKGPFTFLPCSTSRELPAIVISRFLEMPWLFARGSKTLRNKRGLVETARPKTLRNRLGEARKRSERLENALGAAPKRSETVWERLGNA